LGEKGLVYLKQKQINSLLLGEIIMIDLTGESSTLLFRIVVAAFLGALIGFERDIHGRAAGLRTHLLVSMGAAVFVILSELIASFGQTDLGSLTARPDPGRIAAQVVTGIGFLGAGAIIKEGLTIRGLTTAASLWVVAGIGMASGAGYYKIASLTTLLALCCLVGLKYFEKLYQKDSYRVFTVVTTNDVDLSRVIEIVKGKKLKIIFFDFERDYLNGTTTIELSIRLFHRGITDKFAHDIVKSLEQANVPLKSIRWDRP
jgi:putative Mg2+ transporter-C (MgtC) family protein